jgi:hypothetical protein
MRIFVLFNQKRNLRDYSLCIRIYVLFGQTRNFKIKFRVLVYFVASGDFANLTGLLPLIIKISEKNKLKIIN